MRVLDRLQPLALLALRLALGVVMVGHGYPKVFGGLTNTVHFIGSLGLPGWLGVVLAFAEFFGGLAILIGLFTRFAALLLLVDMGVAIWKVHWKHGLLGEGGYQFPLALAAIAFALIFFGAGPISLDAIRGGGGGKAKAS